MFFLYLLSLHETSVKMHSAVSSLAVHNLSCIPDSEHSRPAENTGIMPVLIPSFQSNDSKNALKFIHKVMDDNSSYLAHVTNPEF